MSRSYEELNKFSGADVWLFIRNYDEAASEREGFIRRIKVLKGIIRNKEEKKRNSRSKGET